MAHNAACVQHLVMPKSIVRWEFQPLGYQSERIDEPERKPCRVVRARSVECEQQQDHLSAECANEWEEELALRRDTLGSDAPAHDEEGQKICSEQSNVGRLNAIVLGDTKNEENVVRRWDCDSCAPVLCVQLLLHSGGRRLAVCWAHVLVEVMQVVREHNVQTE